MARGTYCGGTAPLPSALPVGPYPTGAPIRASIEVWVERQSGGVWDRVIQLRTGTVTRNQEIDGHVWTIVDWNA